MNALHAVLLLASGTIGALAGDWPQFLGPERNGVSPEHIAERWPAEGPRTVWSRSVGAGFSGPVVAEGRVILHHRRGDEEIIECWDATREGPSRWRQAYPTRYRDDFGFDEGPRATPAISENRIFAFGAEGTLTCVDFTSGELLWSVPAAKQFGAHKGFFGFACSPLVHEGRVMVNLGGRGGAGIVAFDIKTGALAWKTSDHEASYASPTLATIDGSRLALFFTRNGLLAVQPQDGRVAFQFPWRSRQNASVNAATPLVLTNGVFLTASYGTGAALLRIQDNAPIKLWSSDEALSSHYASVVEHEGYIYGFHGRQEYGPSLRCVEAATGRVQWSDDSLGAGSLLRAADCLVILSEKGELCVAKASPSGFEPTARAQVLGSSTRAFAAIADGRLYARDTQKLICLDLRPAPSGQRESE